MKTRKQYLDREVTHEEYYRQFVTPSIKQAVRHCIGLERIKRSKDPAFNDIPLALWDNMLHVVVSTSAPKQLKECGDWLSQAASVCILKQAARMLIETQTAQEAA